MPVHLVVTRTDGQGRHRHDPGAASGSTATKRTTLRVAKEPAIKTIEIDPKNDFPDVDRENQIWPR